MAVKNKPQLTSQPNAAVLKSMAQSFGQFDYGNSKLDEYSLVFIDSAVDELELLLSGVKEPAKVFVLHPHEDGIRQITTVLNQEYFSSVHIVAHGMPGSLRLGSTRLNAENVNRLDSSLQGKSLLIYGCQVASGVEGESFIQALHQATGANIAAATHPVGSPKGGARWILDYHIGQIPQPELAFTPEVMESYSGIFIEVSLSADTTTLIEDEGTETTLTIQLDEPPPEGGLTVNISAGEEFALGDFDVFPPPPQATATGGRLVAGFQDNSGFEFLVQEQTATITLPISDDPDRPPEDPDSTRNDDIGVENLTFSVLESGDYTVSSDQGAVTLTLADTASQLDGGNGGNGGGEPPTVSLEITPDQAVESETTAVTWNFTVDGDIPEDGLYVYVDSDLTQSLNEFDLFQLVNTGGDFPVGDFDFTGFAFNITEPEASITIPTLDDGLDEGTEEITYEILTRDQIDAQDLNEVESAGGDTIDDYVIGSGIDTITVVDTLEAPNTAPEADDDSYTTDFNTELTVGADNGVLVNDTDADGDDLTATIAEGPSSGTVTLDEDGSFTYTPNEGFSGEDSFTYTVSDGEDGTDEGTVTVTVDDAPPPPPEPLVVGISAAPTDLVEEDGTTTTLTFNLSEAPPEGGVEVTVDSDIISSLDEFDLDAASFSGAELVATDDDASGFTLNVTQQEATVELPVSDDDLDEGVEQITYALQVSGDYEIDGDASSVTLSIEDDDAVEPPENAAPVADEDSYTTTTDNPLTVSADEGVLEGDTDPDGDELVATFVGDASNGSVELEEDGSFTYTPNPGFVGTDSFTYQASDGEATSDVTTVTIEVEEDVVVTPDEPVVSFNIEPDVVSEAEGTELVMNFSVDGEIPEGGITVSLEGDAPRIQQELIGSQTRFDEDLNVFYRFDTGLVEENVEGGELDQFALEADDPSSTGFLSDFTFTITEPNASITFPVFDDLLEEEDETFTYTLVDGENYNVDPDSNSDSFTVIDGVEAGVGPTVGVTASPDTLVESEQTVLELTFTLDEPPPADGVVVYLDSGEPRSIAEFDINASNPRDPEDELAVEGVEVEGGNIVGTNETVSAVLLRMSEQTTTLRVPVFQDDVEEGPETFTYTLLDGEAYEVDDDADSVTFSIQDQAVEPDEPVVSFNVEPDVVSEEDEPATVTASFSVDGEIPEDGLSVLLTGDVNELLNQVDGSVDIGFNNVEVGEFFDAETGTTEVVLLDNQGSFTFPILDDVVAEPDQELAFTLIENDGSIDSDYTVDSSANSDSFTLIDGIGGPEVGPTVGFSFSDTELTEGEEFTVNFDVDGEIPEEGVTVLVESETPGILGEFVLFDDDGNPLFETTGIDGVPEVADAIGSSFLATLTDNNASITLSTFDDGAGEGLEELSFNIVDGEIYQVDPDAGEVVFTIDDSEVSGGGTEGDDTLRGDQGDDAVSGNDGDDRIAGAGGNDNLSGDEGDDLIAGNQGNDQVSGGEGDDTLYGGDGDDTLRGDQGDDRASGGSGNDSLIGGEGDDLIAGNLGDDTASGGEGDDTVYGGDGTDLITGEEGDDYLVGVDGDDIIFAGEDDDFVGGAAGDDTLSGDAGNDTISGGVGDDLIMGVTGDDLIAGNAGSDTFVFGNGDGTDTIRDFQLGTDFIGLVEGELMYEDLSFAAVDAGLAMEVKGTGETLAILNGLDVESLSQDSFVMVPDISDPSQVVG